MKIATMRLYYIPEFNHLVTTLRYLGEVHYFGTVEAHYIGEFK